MEERFTDDELAFLRHARFGELPNRVRPEERVELEEIEAPRTWIDVGPSREQQQTLNAWAG
ncbi:hypothetical protein [Dactylosporangium salmoneum]|uniref:Transposase n=1 Tax=Dactylosporangium salmoneum TaxID=53361 RepID=A0ABN3H6L2_9ACTN